jgi:uncharacterized protein YPO0396
MFWRVRHCPLMDADDRSFVQQLLRRHEKSTDAMVRELNALTRRVDAGTDALARRTDQVIARMEAQTRQMEAQTRQMEAQRREFTEESRAQRAALFRIFDRLNEGGSAAGA